MSRRAFLARAAAAGALAAGAAACGRNDAGVFAQGATTSSTGASATGGSSSALAGSTTAAPTTSSATTPTSTATPGGAAVTGELVTRFTYAVRSSGGRVNNPYVAVWVENADGELVDTIALWYLQSQKGTRWLPELRRWYAASASTRSDTVSSATRAPGAYTVAWDCTDHDGGAVPAGDYFLCIEAAREHGPYSLIRQRLSLDHQGFTLDLPANAELADASATFTAR